MFHDTYLDQTILPFLILRNVIDLTFSRAEKPRFSWYIKIDSIL